MHYTAVRTGRRWLCPHGHERGESGVRFAWLWGMLGVKDQGEMRQKRKGTPGGVPILLICT